jgi:serine/threonine protein kinase
MHNGAAQAKDSWLLNVLGLCLEARFEITKPIGIGSYAELFLAKNLAPRRDEPPIVVVKALNLLLHGALEPDLERTLIENIALEAQTMRSFKHDHIARLFGYGGALDHDGRQFYYLALEYMPGGSMAEFCHAQPLSLERTVHFTEQLCSALSYVHSQGKGVLHRDVKPTNIMLSADRRSLKLLDFGTARLLSTAGGSITKVGTDLYAAPEHFSLSDVTTDELTPAADVYGLAKTVYYMLCGTSPAPFKQRQITGLAPQVHSEPWAKGVLSVLAKATRRTPSARYQTVEEFYEDLRNCSELTVHTERHSAGLNERARSRIVVEITDNPRHDHPGTRKSLSPRGAVYLSRVAALIARGCEAAWDWCRPMFRSDELFDRSDQRVQCLRTGSFRLVLRVTAVMILSLTLFLVMPPTLRWWRSRHTLDVNQQGRSSLTDKQATAITDINIRSGPSGKNQKIGLVERGSRVRILSASRDEQWAEIEVVQHSRGKEIPASADRGWVNQRYLTPE